MAERILCFSSGCEVRANERASESTLSIARFVFLQTMRGAQKMEYKIYINIRQTVLFATPW